MGPHAEIGPPKSGGPLLDRLQTQGMSLKQFKKHIEGQCIAEALAQAGGSVTRAAGLLGMKRPRLSQLVKEHELGPYRPRAQGQVKP